MAITAQLARLRRRTWLAAAVVTLLVAAVTAALVVLARPELRRREAARRWDELARCVLGEQGADTPNPSQRLQMLELWADVDRGRERPDAWPAHCLSQARALADALRALDGRYRTRSLAHELEPLLNELTLERLELQIGTLLTDANESDLPRLRGGPVPSVPRAAEIAAKPPLVEAKRFLVTADRVPGRALDLVLDGPPRLCRSEPGLARLTCTRLAAWMFQARDSNTGDMGLFPATREDAAPPHVEMTCLRIRNCGVYLPAATEPQVAGNFLDHWVAKDGSIAALTPQATLAGWDFTLWRASPGQTPTAQKFELADKTWMRLVGPWLITSRSNQTLVSRVLPVQEPIGDPIELGRFDSSFFGACRSGAGQFVVLWVAARLEVFFERQGRWTHVARPAGPEPFASHGSIERKLSCAGDTLTLVAFERLGKDSTGDFRVHRSSCTPRVCRADSPLDLHLRGYRDELDADGRRIREGSIPRVGQVGDKLLVVWSSPHGGLRLRLAAMNELANAADRLLSDRDPLYELFVRGEHALVVAELEPEKLGAFRIGADGSIEPVSFH